MPLAVVSIYLPNNYNEPQQTLLDYRQSIHNSGPLASMPPLHSNEENKISKATRPKTRLVNQRFANMKSRFHLQTKRPLSERNPELANKISQMRLNIAPIVHVATGQPAPNFPRTMLSLFTLTEDRLDELAHYYSQSHTPTEFTNQYPQRMDWNKPFLASDPSLPEDCKLSGIERLKIKMRMFARFIGMQGADTPQWEYERQVEILGNKIGRVVRAEEEETLRHKMYRGPAKY